MLSKKKLNKIKEQLDPILFEVCDDNVCWNLLNEEDTIDEAELKLYHKATTILNTQIESDIHMTLYTGKWNCIMYKDNLKRHTILLNKIMESYCWKERYGERKWEN